LGVEDDAAHVVLTIRTFMEIGPVGLMPGFPRYAKMATALRLPFVAIVDRDAPMQCNRMLITSKTKIQTSSTMKALYLAGTLSDEELEKFEGTKTKANDLNAPVSYKEDAFEPLKMLARSKRVFVLDSELEGTLQTDSNGKRGKPIRALDSIKAKLDRGEISPVLKDLIVFLKENVSDLETLARLS